MRYLFALLLCFSASAQAADPWSTRDLVGETAFMTLLAVDYGQTRSIHGFCDGRVNCTIHETNPFLGEDPGRARIRNYFLTAAVSHVLITHVLPSEYRGVWQGLTIGFEGGVALRNARLGLRVKF